MTLRVIFDESHGEFLKIANTKILQALLSELNFIVFPLVDLPITFEKLKDDQILLIGCPSIPFSEDEIHDIIKFVEMGNFLILISGSGGDYANNTNLSEIARRFEFEFNPDYVEDDRHHLGFSRIPIIYKFKKNPIFKRVKKVIYSGCSISILDPSTSSLMLTDSDAIPMKSPIMVMSENHLILGIGGYSLFSDDPNYGIKAMDNLRCAYNLFHLLKSWFGKTKERVKKKSSKMKKITLRSAKKKFLKLLSNSIQKISDLSEKIDEFWVKCSDLINLQQYRNAKKMISFNYSQILKKIDAIATEIGGNFHEYATFFPDFKKSIKDKFNQWYEAEAEIRAKLDMIRNNLISKINLK